jgi:hypothetical protein
VYFEAVDCNVRLLESSLHTGDATADHNRTQPKDVGETNVRIVAFAANDRKRSLMTAATSS